MHCQQDVQGHQAVHKACAGNDPGQAGPYGVREAQARRRTHEDAGICTYAHREESVPQYSPQSGPHTGMEARHHRSTPCKGLPASQCCHKASAVLEDGERKAGLPGLEEDHPPSAAAVARACVKGTVPKAEAGGQGGRTIDGQIAEGKGGGTGGPQEERRVGGSAVAVAVGEEGDVHKGLILGREGAENAGDDRPAHQGDRGGRQDSQRSHEDSRGHRGNGSNADEVGRTGGGGYKLAGRARVPQGEVRGEPGTAQAGRVKIPAATQKHSHAVDVDIAWRCRSYNSRHWQAGCLQIFQPQR
mmetsp:Transcript_35666/g.81776  ORF Transcript_35666/g.81776 Transcript_35666/m.81776 type:complete len:301 (+) Transcript_35666:1902-2804(+)